MKIEMGKVYWKIDNTTASFDTLKSTLEGFGLIAVTNRHLGNEFGFKRVIDWQTEHGISFSTIWHINLCNIRIGEWDIDLAEITFDSIIGSYLPYADHDTIDFVYRGNTVLRLALKGGAE
jgi:hypothetical protein